ncbi:MAG: MotA/TolQ/ExbB proton channel family protein [Pseudomonadales bacterium]|nr:MotA/TolQ/ExbB proton channel family protein [Pseudomonadales bacterium]
MRILLIVLFLLLSSAGWTQNDQAEPGPAEQSDGPQSLAELVQEVRQGSAARRAELQIREQRFIDARDNQEALLEQARQQRAEQEAEADRLRDLYEQGEDELADLEDLLVERSGDLNEVFAVVTQVASDAVPVIQNSLVSAQYTDRLPMLESLASGESMPSSEQLRGLWLTLMDEMMFSGEVDRFDTSIITGGGEEAARRVTRIGAFTALSEGEYLRYLPETGRLLALARQPSGPGTSNARAFEMAEEPLVSIAIDPSRGSILSLIVQTPELGERIRQGGLIGYLILVIGAIGLLLGLERILVLSLAAHRSKRVLSGGNEAMDHPINSIRKITRNPDYLIDAEAMSAKLDEIVATTAQRLRRGLPTLAIFAAVSPLLGLLGTVTGMIETFQVITLFGAGDPRLMSGGISQALVTTQLGLAVAIPLLLIHSWLQGQANKLIAELDELAAGEFAGGRSESRKGKSPDA